MVMSDRVPRHIVLRVETTMQCSLTIDGEEFPWALVGEDLGAMLGPIAIGNSPTITITIPADRIDVLYGDPTAVD